MPVSIFETTTEFLHNLLEEAARGKLQLPDFQRGWVWSDSGIRGLLASVSQSFPIGAVMMLKVGGELRFRPRLLEGIDPPGEQQPTRLILDGQQRLTSLFQACCLERPVETENEQRRRIDRWYYIDMAKALDPSADREEAIVGVPEDRRITRDFGRDVVLDVNSMEREFAECHFPLNRVFREDEWAMGYQEFWDFDREKIIFFNRFKNLVLNAFQQYQMPVISLSNETSKEAVCLVFEKVNTGGKKLDSFELLTAIYAAEEFNLRDDWIGNTAERKEGRLPRLARYNVLQHIASTDFLQAISLLHTRDLRRDAVARGVTNPKELPPVSCQRKAILELPLSAYERYASCVEEAFERAARFVTLQKVFWFKDVPYPTQLVPLAAILVELGESWDNAGVRNMLAQWYWCGVFGELYGSATETRFAKDFLEVPAWVRGGSTPTTIVDASFSADRLWSLRSRLSAAYKGLNALLKKEGGRDLLSEQPIEYTSFWEENIDIHHVFPKAWCERNGIPRDRYDSIVNKTPLSARTNRIIGGNAPADYLASVEGATGLDSPHVDAILATHRIPAGALRENDFDAFWTTRSELLLQMIGNAMGKAIARERWVDRQDVRQSIEDVLDSVEDEPPFPEGGEASAESGLIS